MNVYLIFVFNLKILLNVLNLNVNLKNTCLITKVALILVLQNIRLFLILILTIVHQEHVILTVKHALVKVNINVLLAKIIIFYLEINGKFFNFFNNRINHF